MKRIGWRGEELLDLTLLFRCQGVSNVQRSEDITSQQSFFTVKLEEALLVVVALPPNCDPKEA